MKELVVIDREFSLALLRAEKKLSKRQYITDGFTPKLLFLRKQRRYWRKTLRCLHLTSTHHVHMGRT